ncbi:MAG: DUF502 domain-containing protein [Chlamydiota bacterium]|nr:DUF502 domain-containing protein [Chlamydiota bacterium]
MAKIKTIFFNGLKVLVPLLVTVLLIYWTFIGFEKFFKSVLLLFIDPSHYFSGLGWIAAIILTALLGLLVQIPFVLKGADKLKNQLLKLPVIKTLYRMSSDIMTFLTKKEMREGKIVKFKTPIGSVLGIMTQDQLSDLPDGIGDKKEVAVYVPMSYQIGGFTFIVPKDSIEILDISVQKGIALTMTAYISGKNTID